VEKSSGGLRMNIHISYMKWDFSGEGATVSQQEMEVPNYRTLRSLLSALEAAAREIEAEQGQLPPPPAEALDFDERNGAYPAVRWPLRSQP
jgi:hypothetical protein